MRRLDVKGFLESFRGPKGEGNRHFVMFIAGLAIVAGVTAEIIDPMPVSLDVIAAGVIFIVGLNIQQAYRGAQVDARIGALDAKLDTRIGELDTKLDVRIGKLEVKIDTINEGTRLLKDQLNINVDIANRCCPKKRKYNRIR